MYQFLNEHFGLNWCLIGTIFICFLLSEPETIGCEQDIKPQDFDLNPGPKIEAASFDSKKTLREKQIIYSLLSLK